MKVVSSSSILARLIRHKKNHIQILSSILLYCVSALGFAATFNVSTEQEIRDAVVESATNNESDTINLGGNTIALTQDLVTGLGGQLVVEADFSAAGPRSLVFTNGTIERDINSPPFRLMAIIGNNVAGGQSLSQVSLVNMTLRNGLADLSDSATVNVDPINGALGGGAVYTQRILNVENTLFENNSVLGNGNGGAIFSQVELNVSASEFESNSITPSPNGAGSGGAIYTNNRSTIDRSNFYNNSATNGGAVASPLNSSQVIERSTFRGNQASGLGGAVWSRTLPRADNPLAGEIFASTFVENNAGIGGGAIYLQTPSSVTLRHITVWDNSAAALNGSGLRFVAPSNGSDLSIINSIIGANLGANCVQVGNSGIGVPDVSSGNFSTDGSCGNAGFSFGSINGQFSDGLSDNGNALSAGTRFTLLTLPLGELSAARDVADQNNCFASDQRSFAVAGEVDLCDAGAFELLPLDLDTDGDGVFDDIDNCIAIPNLNQLDSDNDGLGDVCDDEDNADDDGDGVSNFEDNCPFTPNADQADADLNGTGDVCDDVDNDGVIQPQDNCPVDANPGQEDFNLDGIGDACGDADNDGRIDDADNCPIDANPNQADNDTDGSGDVCDVDDDNDGTEDDADNCPVIANQDQSDVDGDGIGDVCDDDDNRPDLDGDGQPDVIDLDDDNDGVNDEQDNCPREPNDDQADADGDGIGDVCDDDDNRPDLDGDGIPDAIDPDDDGDGVDDGDDNCPILANADQADVDGDGVGDVCDDDDNRPDLDGDGIPDVIDPDDDGDGVDDADDNCPVIANADQADVDGDGIGDLCDDTDDRSDLDGDGIPDAIDPDDDGDGVDDIADNCPVIPNTDQSNVDGDAFGDACDEEDNRPDADGDIRPAVTTAAAELDAIIASSSGSIKRVLEKAAAQLDNALKNRHWSSDNTLSTRRGAGFFNNLSVALNEIERVADSRYIDSGLRAQLDAITGALLDNARLLAANQIAKAQAHGVSSLTINAAKRKLDRGDNHRSLDWLRTAAIDYGNAWYLVR